MKRPASIGIVLHDFPLGGTERIALRLAHAWIASGVAVTLFVGDDKGPLRTMIPEGARVILASPPIPRSRGSRQRLGRAAADLFAVDRVDGLFVTGNFHWEIVPALATIPQRPPIVVQISSPLAMPQRGWMRQGLFLRRMRRLLCHADALVAMSEGYRIDADRIMGRAIARTIPLPALNDDKKPPKSAEGRTILAAGRLIRQKGFDLLIKAFDELNDPEARLLIVGSGPEERALRRQAAAARSPSSISLVGYVHDIRPFLDAARLFILPSRFEGYGAVIIEALGAGRPVIATASTPAVDDVLRDPKCGLVVPVEDVTAITAGMRTLLDHAPPDPARLAQTVAAFRIGRGADAYLNLFADAAR
jgi:glycosyltransferase involved in cell wall biosynthesis